MEFDQESLVALVLLMFAACVLSFTLGYATSCLQ